MIGAVDIGGTKIAVGMVDDKGKVLSRMESPTDPNRYSDGIELIAHMLRRTAQRAGGQITGIGIGSTGPVDPIRGEFGDVDFLPGWRGKSPVKDLAQVFTVQVALENDADAAALAEAGWGAGRNRTRLIYVTVGTGIGGGIVLDGKLYRGVDGAHPEIGHHVIDPAGPQCTCGFRGCWESLAAGPAMVGWLQHNAPPDYRTATESRRNASANWRAKPTRSRYRPVETEAYYLGLGLANLINLFTPDAIVLSGSVMKSADLLMGRMRDVIRKGCRFVPANKRSWRWPPSAMTQTSLALRECGITASARINVQHRTTRV